MERTLDADLLGHPPDGERRAGPSASTANDDALEVLGSRPATLGNPDTNSDRIPGTEFLDPWVDLDWYELLGLHDLALKRPHGHDAARPGIQQC